MYQTRKQLLLDLLKEEFEEELRLSEERVEFLTKDNDIDSMLSEYSFNSEVKQKLKHIQSLIDLEQFSHAGVITQVTMAHVKEDGKVNSPYETKYSKDFRTDHLDEEYKLYTSIIECVKDVLFDRDGRVLFTTGQRYVCQIKPRFMKAINNEGSPHTIKGHEDFESKELDEFFKEHFIVVHNQIHRESRT